MALNLLHLQEKWNHKDVIYLCTTDNVSINFVYEQFDQLMVSANIVSYAKNMCGMDRLLIEIKIIKYYTVRDDILVLVAYTQLHI